METRTGNLSINSENMLPIIKKWLYSDHDIFARELVSNGCDAISKLHKLEIMGEYQYPDKHKDSIRVIVDPDQKIAKFIDTGLGMTESEVEEYITQIAFSGASAFFEKYKDKANKDDIIGHFGLGFYSVFMVSDRVEIDSLSWQKDAQPVHWECDGSATYEIGEGTWNEIGTCITLHLNEDCVEFSNEYRMREVLERYCSFMPVEIFLSKEGAAQEYEEVKEEDLKEDDVIVDHVHHDAVTREEDDGEGGKKTVEVTPARDMVKINRRPVPLNDTKPLWGKHPNDCTDEEYKDFYRKVFNDYRDPLFWIHLNMDYPFNLKGILYFPKLNLEYENYEGVIKLYNNQVFVADNIKEVIPEFMLMLRGVIDCPDFPLNVSRSALQNDGFVKKVSDYIAKKIADKLTGMCKTDRETYEKYWNDISIFIKYGCLRDSKFNERLKDYMLYENIDGKFFTLKEYLEHIGKGADKSEETVEGEGTSASEGEKPEADETVDFTENPDDLKAEAEKAGDTDSTEPKEEEKTTIYYITDEVQQGQYIRMFKESGLDAVKLMKQLDSAFISHVEQEDPSVKFERIDADITGSMKEEGDENKLKEETDALSEIFKKALGKDRLTVKVENLKDEKISSMLTLPEEGRRMQDMMRMYSGNGMDMSMFAPEEILTLNGNNKLVRFLLDNKEAENTELFAKQLYDLASLANKQLPAEEMARFIERSNEIMLLLAK